MLGLSTGQVGSGLCSTCIRPNQIEWTNFQPATDRNSSKDENGPKSFQISSEIAKISTRFGEILPNLAKNLTRSSKISPNLAKKHLKTHRIYQITSEYLGVGWIGFIGFRRRRSDVRPVKVGFWRKQSVADCRRSRLGR